MFYPPTPIIENYLINWRHNEVNLTSHTMAIENPQNIPIMCFQPISMTFTLDVKIDLIMFEPYQVQVFDFLTY